MKKNLLLLSLCVLTTLLQGQTVQATLTLFNPGGYIAATDASTMTLQIESNASWTARSNETWITVSPTTGNGNGTITLTANANTSTINRKATISVQASNTMGSTTCTVDVTQLAGTSAVHDITEKGWKVYLNANKEQLIIDGCSDNAKICILDINGKKLISQHDLKDYISISSLPNGIFVLKIFTIDGVYTTKFVK